MKYLSLFILTLLSFDSLSQVRFKHDFVPPQLLDTARFKKDIICQTKLDSAFNLYKKDTSNFLYRYFFKVKKDGQIQPNMFYGDINTIRITEYIKETFNQYRWKAGYIKGCGKCNEDLNMELDVFITTDEDYISESNGELNNIVIQLIMKDAYPDEVIYELKLTYMDLISLYRSEGCDIAK